MKIKDVLPILFYDVTPQGMTPIWLLIDALQANKRLETVESEGTPQKD